jgi:HAD superfamily hydrolase (TIGR01490 family)
VTAEARAHRPGAAPAGPEAGRAAAFFDLDRTLMAGSSAFAFVRAARKAGFLTRRDLAKAAYGNARFRLRGSTDADTAALREAVGRTLEGVRVRDVMRLAPDILAGLLPRLYPQMLQVAYDHQDTGRPIYIVTAASQEMCELVATVLRFDGGIGTRAERRDGVYTGRMLEPFTYREGKALAIRELAREQGYDLAASWGYSDSESDLPMLRAVGHPVVVNPDAELLRVAREEGWEILTFETLGRSIKLAAGLLAVAAAGGAAYNRRGGSVQRRRLPRPR